MSNFSFGRLVRQAMIGVLGFCLSAVFLAQPKYAATMSPDKRFVICLLVGMVFILIVGRRV